MRRSPMGFAKRVMQQNELAQYPAWERLLSLHRLSWWHNTIAQRSQPGWPDYTVFGDGWHAWVELKGRDARGRAGKLSTGQVRYKEDIERAGGEYRVFLLPDDWQEANAWLRSHTGRQVTFQ